LCRMSTADGDGHDGLRRTDTANSYRDFRGSSAAAAVLDRGGDPPDVRGGSCWACRSSPSSPRLIGIFGTEPRYDRLSKEFNAAALIAYSATAIWGAVCCVPLSTLCRAVAF